MDGTIFDAFECDFPLIRAMAKVTSNHQRLHTLSYMCAPVMLVMTAVLVNVATEARLVIGHACRILKCVGASNVLIY
jgi:hypothetical protein